MEGLLWKCIDHWFSKFILFLWCRCLSTTKLWDCCFYIVKKEVRFCPKVLYYEYAKFCTLFLLKKTHLSNHWQISWIVIYFFVVLTTQHPQNSSLLFDSNGSLYYSLHAMNVQSLHQTNLSIFQSLPSH